VLEWGEKKAVREILNSVQPEKKNTKGGGGKERGGEKEEEGK